MRIQNNYGIKEDKYLDKYFHYNYDIKEDKYKYFHYNRDNLHQKGSFSWSIYDTRCETPMPNLLVFEMDCVDNLETGNSQSTISQINIIEMAACAFCYSYL